MSWNSIAGAARLVLSRRRAGQPPVLVRRGLRDVEIARSAGLILPLLDALFGVPDPVREVATVGHAEGARRAGRHIVPVECLDPKINRARRAVQLVGLDHGPPIELKTLGHARFARPADESSDRGIRDAEKHAGDRDCGGLYAPTPARSEVEA